MFGIYSTIWGTVFCWLAGIVLLLFFFFLLFNNEDDMDNGTNNNRLLRKILRKRYALGEISKEEFREMKKTIL